MMPTRIKSTVKNTRSGLLFCFVSGVAGGADNAAVKTASGTVAGGAAGAACAVQVSGFVTVGYSGDAPALGRVCLAADGNGGVKSAGDGVACLAADVDTTAKTVTILL